MSKGIIYIAFGAEYAKLAYNTIRYSRHFTDLPITVIHNIKPGRVPWDKISVDEIALDMPTDKNREIKTLLNNYTPYDETLYMDCDTVIQKPGIEKVFDLLGDYEILFQQHYKCEIGCLYYRIYQKAFKKTGTRLPLTVTLGGFFCFKRTHNVNTFFIRWNEFWKLTGSGRDMPAMACAVKQSPALSKKIILQYDTLLFSFGINNECVAVHRLHKSDLLKYFNIPIHKQNKPFDKPGNSDWGHVKL